MGIFSKMKSKSNLSAPMPPKTRKKVGIAFGGGGIKGSAHVGVLKVLSEHNIPIDYVAGTSIGSAVAALFASGYDWEQLDFMFTKYDVDDLIKVRPNRKGLVSADGYEDMIRTCTQGKRIEEMDIPLKIVAVDLLSRKKIIFSKGDTALAVKASSAIPGVFKPVKMDNMLLVDGYILDNCPAKIVRNMGADIVIAINLYAPDQSIPNNILDIVNRSLDIATSSLQEIDADVLLEPISHYLPTLDPDGITQSRLWGEECALECIDQIVKLTRG